MTSLVRSLGHLGRPLLLLLLIGFYPITSRAQSHYSCLDGSGNIFNATVIVSAGQVPTIDGAVLSPGSEIAVFSADPSFADVCVGKLTWQGSSAAITVWGDDDLTAARDGIRPEEELQFRIWDNSSGLAHNVSSSDISILNGAPYSHDALFVISSLNVSSAIVGLVANNDTAVTSEDVEMEIDVLGNDNGGSSTLDPSSVAILVPPISGTVTSINPATGRITYVPNANYSGLDSFTYVVFNTSGSDSKTASVDVTIQPANDPPAARADIANTDEDQPVVIPILANDTDLDDASLDYSSVSIRTPPLFGQIVSIDDENGDVTYSPSANFNGQDRFTYTVLDPHGAESAATDVDITVKGVNDAPVAVVDSGVTDEDTQLKIRVLDNDTDVDGDELDPGSIQIRTFPANGSIKNIHPGSGMITYKPDPDFNGADSFTYRVRDIHGKASNEVSVNVTVLAVNDSPTYVGNPVKSTKKGKPFRVVATFSDPDNDPIIISPVIAPSWMIITDNGDGTAILDGTPSDSDTGEHHIELFADDGRGGTLSYAYEIVVADNAAPLASTDAVSIQEDTQILIDVLSNDVDPEGDAIDVGSIVIISPPLNGTVLDISATTGAITYEPLSDFYGMDRFEYAVSDIYGNSSNIVEVSISISPVGDAPLAIGETIDMLEDSEIIIDVLRNDTDADGELLLITEATGTGNGVVLVNPDGQDITYIPLSNFSGTDTFSYTVIDNTGQTSTATVTVNVGAVNDLPTVTESPTSSLSTGVPYTHEVSVSDIDGDAVSVQVLSAPGWLGYTSGSDGLTYFEGTPTIADLGIHQIVLQISDGIESFEYEIRLAVSEIGSQLTESAELLSPAYGATDVHTDTRFSWERIPYALQYQLQVTSHLDPQFENPLFDRLFTYGTSATNAQVNYMVFNLPTGVRLVWRVRAQNNSGFSPWSAISEYVTHDPGTSTPTETLDELPASTELFQNYPNPFNPTTTISFELPEATNVELTVYDMTGREVTTLVSRTLPAGTHAAIWDAGSRASGIYLYRLRAGSFAKSKTLTLIK